jgi:hypothetical protein
VAAKKDPLKEKQARQKKIAIVGGILLVGVMAFQIPRTMKMLHSSTPETTAASTTASATPGSTPLAPPSLDGSTASSASAGTGSAGGATSADGVVDASSPLPASSGQLVSFSRFKTKDPFAQQVQDCANGCASTPPAGATAGSTTSTGSGTVSGTTTVPGVTGTGTNTPGSSPGSSGSSAPNPTSASISVNGATSRVTVGQTFPSKTPVFVLVSLTSKAAKISISGGSIEGGAPTVTLTLGKTVRLQNTSDGALYVLRLAGTA